MRKALPAVILLVSLAACNRKPKLEGKVTGYKPGSTSIVMVHAKATKGSRVWCAAGGHACDPFDMPASGEKDIEVDLSKGHYDTPAKVMLTASYNDKNQEVVPLDLATSVPPALETSSNGYISCAPRECTGSIDVMTAKADVHLPAGSIFEVGSTKLTADASGKAQGPIPIAPAVKDLPLSKVCAHDASTLATWPVKVTFPDKTTAATTFQYTTEVPRTKLVSALEGVKKGPVLFPWESGAAAKGKPAAIYLSTASCYAGGAADATMKDVRVVVFGESKSTRTDTCAYAFNDGTKGSAKITLHDTQATAYDRATGRVVGTKLFEAKKSCDYEVTTKTKNLSDQDTWADSKPIAAWGATLAR